MTNIFVLTIKYVLINDVTYIFSSASHKLHYLRRYVTQFLCVKSKDIPKFPLHTTPQHPSYAYINK